jgi:hypothetical protein
MAAPYRGNTGHGVYFITACTFQKKNLLQSDRMAGLLVEVLLHCRTIFICSYSGRHYRVGGAVHQRRFLLSSEEGRNFCR